MSNTFNLNEFPYFSHSRIKSFENCPLQFKFKYITKPEIELKESIEAFVGKRFHETMEYLYKNLHYTNIPSIDDLIKFYEQQWKKQWNDSIVIIKDSLDKKHYFNYGIKCIKNYYNSFTPFNDSVTLGIEKLVLFPLDKEKKIMIKGFIDRLSKKGSVYQIHDYKTTGTLPDKKAIEKDKQLALYAYGISKEFPDAKEFELIWHYVGFNETITLKQNIKEIKKISLSVLSTIKKIQQEKKFPSMPSALCAYCDYKELCPEWAHILKVQKLPANKYLNEPGVKLANKYAELKNKKNEFNEKIDSELKELEDALYYYAKKNNYSSIAGSEFNLKLWHGKNFSFPVKNSPQFNELKKFLSEKGLLNDFLELDRWQLSRKLASNEFPKEVQEKLLSFVSEKEVRRIYLRKINNNSSD